MKTRTLLSVGTVGLVLIALTVLRIYKSDPSADMRHQPPTLVRVELPSRLAIGRSLHLTGDILPIQQAQVFARVYGNLQSVQVNIGDYVHHQQLLARIDTTELAQQYRQAEATYENAVGLYDRAKSLQEHNLISKQDFDNAETGMAVAKESYEAARTRLEYAEILAPFSGYITRRYLDPGALLTSTNATLFNLADLDTIKIMVNVLEKDVPAVNVGMKAIATVDAYPNRTFAGTIARTSQMVDLATRTMPVEIDMTNTDHALRPGMFATVSIALSAADSALTVPTQALLKDANGYYVLKAQSGTAHRLTVSPGVEQDTRTEIQSGITEGDSIITTGQQFARDGSPVTVGP